MRRGCCYCKNGYGSGGQSLPRWRNQSVGDPKPQDLPPPHCNEDERNAAHSGVASNVNWPAVVRQQQNCRAGGRCGPRQWYHLPQQSALRLVPTNPRRSKKVHDRPTETPCPITLVRARQGLRQVASGGKACGQNVWAPAAGLPAVRLDDPRPTVRRLPHYARGSEAVPRPTWLTRALSRPTDPRPDRSLPDCRLQAARFGGTTPRLVAFGHRTTGSNRMITKCSCAVLSE